MEDSSFHETVLLEWVDQANFPGLQYVIGLDDDGLSEEDRVAKAATRCVERLNSGTSLYPSLPKKQASVVSHSGQEKIDELSRRNSRRSETLNTESLQPANEILEQYKYESIYEAAQACMRATGYNPILGSSILESSNTRLDFSDPQSVTRIPRKSSLIIRQKSLPHCSAPDTSISCIEHASKLSDLAFLIAEPAPSNIMLSLEHTKSLLKCEECETIMYLPTYSHESDTVILCPNCKKLSAHSNNSFVKKIEQTAIAWET